MFSIAEVFNQGGPFMYIDMMCAIPTTIVALIGLAQLVLSLVGKVERRLLNQLGVACLILALGLVAIGLCGWWLGHLQVDSVIAKAPQEAAEELAETGRRVAFYPLQLALYGAIFPLSVSAFLLARGVLGSDDRAGESSA